MMIRSPNTAHGRGRPTPPAALPAWLDGKPLNEWFSIPGTTGGPAAMDAYSGFCVREDTSELFSACSGGHTNSADNSVWSADLRLDSPTWVLRCAPSGTIANDVAYYPDGKPSSRHTYRHNYWVPQLNRVMMFGLRATYPSANNFFTVDGFDPDTNTWDAAGTWANVLDSNAYGEVKDGAGNVWTTAFRKFNPTTVTWSNPGISGGTRSFRAPVTYNPVADELFCMMWSDGYVDGPSAIVNASRIPLSGTTRYDVSFNASAGLTQFEAEKGLYAGMDFDPVSGRFLWYSGVGAAAGRFYWISPNGAGPWDIEVATFGGGSATLGATPGAGVNGKLWYVPNLNGFVLLPKVSDGLYFLRTA